MPDLHVLYVIDSLDRPGGAEQALNAMAPHLVSSGIALDVAYLLDREGFQDTLRAAGVGLHPVLVRSRVARVRALRRLIRQLQPDIVHTTLFESDITGRMAAQWAGVPSVSSLVNASYGPEHVSAPGLRPTRVRAAQLVDAATAHSTTRLHAISSYVAETMSRRLRLDPARIDVIPRGRDLALLGVRSPARRDRVRRSLGVDLTTPLILAAARHEHQKGLDVLVSAMAGIHAALPTAVLIVAGREGNATPRIRSILATQQRPDQTHLLGARQDVADLMCAADVFVAPSRWEGLGSAAIEALGCEVPIVVSDVPALREAVGGEGVATLVRPEDPTALARAVVDALQAPLAATQRAAAGRQRFSQHFAIDMVAAAMRDFYARAARPVGRAARL